MQTLRLLPWGKPRVSAGHGTGLTRGEHEHTPHPTWQYLVRTTAQAIGGDYHRSHFKKPPPSTSQGPPGCNLPPSTREPEVFPRLSARGAVVFMPRLAISISHVYGSATTSSRCLSFFSVSLTVSQCCALTLFSHWLMHICRARSLVGMSRVTSGQNWLCSSEHMYVQSWKIWTICPR